MLDLRSLFDLDDMRRVTTFDIVATTRNYRSVVGAGGFAHGEGKDRWGTRSGYQEPRKRIC
jgi:hypothetical protein